MIKESKKTWDPCFVGGDIHPYRDILLEDHLGIHGVLYTYVAYTFQYSKLLCCGMSFFETITRICPILIQQPSGKVYSSKNQLLLEPSAVRATLNPPSWEI